MYTARSWEEIKSWPKDNDCEFHIAPNGTRIRLGYDVDIQGDLTFGDRTHIGKKSIIKRDVTLGRGVYIGEHSVIGEWVRLGNCVTLGKNVILGNKVRMGDHVTIKNNVTSMQLVINKISELCKVGRPLVGWKWVTKDRKSPNFDKRYPILKYEKNTIVKSKGDVSDQLCGKGIHICPVGIRPEYTDYCSWFGHKLIHLLVEYMPEDILFPGLPGYSDKLRVRRVKVLE